MHTLQTFDTHFVCIVNISFFIQPITYKSHNKYNVHKE